MSHPVIQAITPFASTGTVKKDPSVLLRERLAHVRWKALEQTDKFLIQFEANIIRRGGKVLWARHGADAVSELQQLALTQQADGFRLASGPGIRELGLAEQLAKQGLRVEHDASGPCPAKTILISEAQFVLADPGAVLLERVHVAAHAPLHVVLAPVDRVLPALRDVYIATHPAHGIVPAGWTLQSGPLARQRLYIMLYDSDRSNIMAEPGVREAMRCIGCEGCDLHDPVAATSVKGNGVRFHPIKAICTPHIRTNPSFAPSFMHPLDNRAAGICPAGIDFKRMFLFNRKLAADRHAAGRPRLFYFLWKKAVTRRGVIASRGLKTLSHFTHVFFNKSTHGQRKEMRAPRKSFNRLWRERMHLN